MGLLGPAEQARAHGVGARYPARRERVRPQPRPRLIAVAEALDPRVTTVEVPAPREPPGVHLEHEALGLPRAVGEHRARDRGFRERRELEVHAPAQRGRAVERRAHAALDLHLGRRGEQVRMIDPVDLVRLGVVERHSVHQDADAALREAADREVGVAHAVPGVGVGIGPRQRGQRHGRVLPPVEARDRGAVQDRARDRGAPPGARRAHLDARDRDHARERLGCRGRGRSLRGGDPWGCREDDEQRERLHADRASTVRRRSQPAP